MKGGRSDTHARVKFCAVGYGFGSHGLLASFHKSYLPPIGRAACAALLTRHDIDLTNLNRLKEFNQIKS